MSFGPIIEDAPLPCPPLHITLHDNRMTVHVRGDRLALGRGKNQRAATKRVTRPPTASDLMKKIPGRYGAISHSLDHTHEYREIIKRKRGGLGVASNDDMIDITRRGGKKTERKKSKLLIPGGRTSITFFRA